MEHILKQYRVFKKHWDKALNDKDLNAAETADTVRRKIAVGLDEFVSNSKTIDEKIAIAAVFAELAEFCEFLIMLRLMNEHPLGDIPTQMRDMAEKCLHIDDSNFIASECMAHYNALNLMHTTAGDSPVIYKGQDTAASIVGTAFNLIGKSLTLGITAAGSEITKSSFNASVHKMIQNYQSVMVNKDTKIGRFVNYTFKMFNIAEICEAERNMIWKEIYAAVTAVDLEKLDHSGDNKELVQMAEERAEELWILADAKL